MVDEEMGADEPWETAALWRRGGARLLDYLAMVAALFALQIIGLTSVLVDDAVSAGLAIAVLYAVLEVVYVAQRGQTPAKELFKIRVQHVGRKGGLGWVTALTRWVIPGVALGVPFLAGGYGILIVPACLIVLGVPALFDPSHRTPWDRLAGTYVTPYDAKLVEGPIRSRKQLVRSAMDRQISAVTNDLSLLREDDDDPGRPAPGLAKPARSERVVDNAGDRWV